MDYSGPLEIVSAQGSVALKGNELVLHVHIQLSSREGCYGGHLAGATVFSTAEVAIGELDYQLQRYADDYTASQRVDFIASAIFTFHYNYNSGYDPKYGSLSAGVLSKALCIKDSIERGKRRFDFLKGDERYKYHLGGQEIQLYKCRINL